MVLNYIKLESVLDDEQSYVTKIASELNVDVKAVHHDIVTNTCFEKADLLGWSPEKVVKAVFFRRGAELYGFIFPELGVFDRSLHLDKKTLAEVLGYTKKQVKKFNNSYCPIGMEYGTCTPFLFESSFDGAEMAFGTDLKRVFVNEIPRLDDEIVDISIGGNGELAHKISLHLPYSAIYGILNRKFGERVQRTHLFN
ncbi:hypothetical protein KAT24_02315 [Candidatus Pacearchaeota archaeon]|nr:hypothetical protein [Candidatus Pacearchaeota archaeon]